MSKLTILEYVSELKRTADKFKEYWEKKQDEEPGLYPNVMYLGDWDEQFAEFEMYMMNREDKDE